MAIRKIGSQVRQPIEESEYSIYERWGVNEVLLIDIETGRVELYAQNDHYAGHVIEIEGKGYEFLSSFNPYKIPPEIN